MGKIIKLIKKFLNYFCHILNLARDIYNYIPIVWLPIINAVDNFNW